MNPARPSTPLSARVFIAVFVLAGVAGLVFSFRGWTPQLPVRFLIYLLVALASSGMKVSFPGVYGNISVNYVFILLGLLEFQLPETLLLAIAGAAAQTLWHAKSKVRPAHLIFNTACMTLTVLAASFVFHRHWISGIPESELLRLLAAGVVYFVVNTLSVSTVIALSEQRSLGSVWKDVFDWSFSYYLVGVSLAEMVHISIERLGWAFTLALLPMLYIIYRSYKLYLEKLEQEKSHANGMASLHLRTIEALAMAIEAKDECTHEHLRRVQVYSLQMAAELGLAPAESQALQAASILHDIGKLAVPDYIISKPGKLTSEEFEKMKIHTVVGAAILEQVGFPYEVTPIVRSHHERWDGTGYPDGLKGEEIPIGARILAAVDCLDALASDRQYRRALPLDEAMDYVASLTGRNFDPQVVDVLKRRYREFERMAQSAPLRQNRLCKDLVVSRGEAPAAGFEDVKTGIPDLAREYPKTFIASIASARQEVQTILELTQDLSGALRLEEMLSVVAERLKRLVPFDCIAVYTREGNVLKPRYVNGENSRAFASLAIPVGQGLSGWVVENGKPIVNGNPSVEPGYLNDPGKFSLLNSALSVPLGDEAGEPIGALTLYRAERDSYSRDHLRVLLAVNGKISRAVESAIRFQQAQLQASTDELTGLPNARSLYLYLQDELTRCEAVNRSLAIMVCDLDGFKHVNDCFGHLTGNEVLRRVARILQSNCREMDYVGRMGGDEFVVLLSGAREDELAGRVETLDRLIRAASRDVCGQEQVGISVGVACFPEHGTDAETLLSRADIEMYRAKRARKSMPAAISGSKRALWEVTKRVG